MVATPTIPPPVRFVVKFYLTTFGRFRTFGHMDTPKVENGPFARMVGRMIRALGRRIATGDIESFGLFADLRKSITDAEQVAATALHDQGYSWAEIGRAAGMTKQGAYINWGAK